MCGRFANQLGELNEWRELLLKWPTDVTLGFNITPSQMIPAFTESGGVGMRWGLVPDWSKDVSSKYATFNARIESVATKPTFRHAWTASQRCLIPALGYYEWRSEQGGKQPYFIRPSDNTVMVFAGLYEPARDETIPASCTIITKPASKDMTELHPRMPVTLDLTQAENWLQVSPDQAGKIALSEIEPDLDVYPVSKAVNNPRNQGEGLVEPVGS